MITLQLSLHSNLRGRGFWKLNTSFLKDEEYAKQIGTIIMTQTKDEYAQDNTVTPGSFWEMKNEIREASINYGNKKEKSHAKAG